MKSLHLLLLFFLSVATTVTAQHRLQGTIQDTEGEPMLFTNVLLHTATDEFVKGEVTDLDGRFAIDNVTAGNYIIHISALGYEAVEQSVVISSDVNLGVLTLAENSVALEEVTVTAQKVAYVRKADRTVVNIGSLPTAAGGNALELIEKSPSVSVDRVSSNVSLLGRDNVLVAINGKRMRLDGTELLQYLASIPAANIVSLELINNPPASYDAEGTGGIINIVLKNYEADGFNGSANVFTGYGQRGKYGGGALFNYKAGKTNVYGDASISQDYTAQDFDLSTELQFNDGVLTTDQRSRRPVLLGNYSVKLGLTQSLNTNTSLDVFGAFARRQWELSAETATNYGGNLVDIQSDLLTGEETNTTDQYNLSGRIQHRFPNGHTLSADYDYLYFNIVNPTSYQLQNFGNNDELVSAQTFNTQKETPFDFHVGRMDYNGSFNDNINFSTGIKATLTAVNNNTALVDDQGVSSENALFTDQMDLTEQIYAAYWSMEGTLGEKFTFTGGVRYEYSDLELNATQANVERRISRLFPNLSLTRTFSDVSQVTLAYRERISRPGFQSLAPAFFFLNPYTVLTGNIQALPNINRTLEMTINHKSLFFSVSYSHDNAPITPQFHQAEDLLLVRWDNIESRQQIGINTSFPIQFTKFWNSRYNFNSYWRRDVVKLEGTEIVESNPFLSIDISQNFQLPNAWTIELSGRWSSRMYQGTVYRPEQTTINMGLQKKLPNGTIGLSWTDIFDSGSFFGMNNGLPGQGIDYNWYYDVEGSVVKLSYSYNFGGNEVKKSRNSGADDVLQRVNQ